jgi:hypothetical protein
VVTDRYVLEFGGRRHNFQQALKLCAFFEREAKSLYRQIRDVVESYNGKFSAQTDYWTANSQPTADHSEIDGSCVHVVYRDENDQDFSFSIWVKSSLDAPSTVMHFLSAKSARVFSTSSLR